jgi:hypothetical protein
MRMKVIGEIGLHELGINVRPGEETRSIKVVSEDVPYGSGEDFYIAVPIRVAAQRTARGVRAQQLIARAWDIINARRKRPTAPVSPPTARAPGGLPSDDRDPQQGAKVPEGGV